MQYKFNYDGKGINWDSSCDSYASRVATMNYGVDNGYERERIGNLLAAAPEMLDALEALLEDLKEIYGSLGWDSICVAENVIARAKGVKND